MDISLQKVDEISGKLIVKVVKSDYEEKVQKSLKKIKQQAKMPGFRPGMVPMGLIQKMYGMEVKAEELQKTISEGINNYIKEQNLNLITSPLTSENETKIDVENAEDFEMHFDLAFTPEIKIELTEKDKIVYYDIDVDEEQVNTQVDSYRRRNGKFEEVEAYEDGDMLRGNLVEMEKKNVVKEGGLKVENVSIMPKYFTNETQKKKFAGATKGDIVFNVSKAYNGKEAEISSLLKIKKEEIENHKGDFKYEITSISRMKLAELNQELFDMVYGKDTVKTEEEFRSHIKSDMENVYVEDSNYKFILDVKDYCLKKVGTVKFPEEIMKREMILNADNEEQKANIEKDFANILVDREWALICSKLVEQLNVKIEDEQMKNAAKLVAKSQFAQYGLNNVPDEYLENYANEMLKDEKQFQRLLSRAIDIELTKAIKATVKLQKKKISIKDFNAMFETK